MSDWLATLPAACDCLRPYQREQLTQLHAALHQGIRRVLLQLATGAGKTHEIASIALAASLADLRVLILATRTRLVRQIHERLEAFGVSHGVIAAPLPQLRHDGSTVQVASADTLYRRALSDERMPMPSADVVIFDEAHLATAETRLQILQSFPEAIRIGFTATPARKSGRSLSAAFDRLILGPGILELIGSGMLVRPRVFNVPVVASEELKALPKDIANDYATGALSGLMSRAKLVGDVVQNWLRIAAGKRTLCFAVDKAHGAQLVQEFSRIGISAELLTDQDDEATREAVMARLEAGQTTIIVNCFLLSYGVDLPSIECIVLARPTRSLVQYMQMVGRGLRPAPDKDSCLIEDHGRVVENLGLPTSDFAWSLDESRNVNREATQAQRRVPITETVRTCPECQHVWRVSEEGERCSCCGWIAPVKTRPIVTTRADLIELDDQATAANPYAPEAVQFFTEALCWYLRRWPQRWSERPKSGRWWAWSQMRTKFDFPETVRIPGRLWEIAPAGEISPAVAGWLQSSMIRYAKSRRTA